MTSTDRSRTPLNVVVAGGGVAGLEAVLALRKLAGDRVAITLVAPNDEFVYGPLSVRAPFAAPGATRHSLARFADDLNVDRISSTLAWVAPSQRSVFTADGHELLYDALVVALGARREVAFRKAITFRGADDAEAVNGLVQDVEMGASRRVAFVVPPAIAWTLPLYELALQTAACAREMNVDVELALFTPERSPLAVFGDTASREIGSLLDAAGIRFEGDVAVDVDSHGNVVVGQGQVFQADRVVALPRLVGPALRGLPSDPQGFIPVDRRGRVHGLQDVFAAGDGVQSVVKQGGIAAQQADAIAVLLARRAGADVEWTQGPPVLRGVLFTGGQPRYMRGTEELSEIAPYPLWWPPAKIAGRYLAPYLTGESVEPPISGLDVEIGFQSPAAPRARRRAVIGRDPSGHATVEALGR